MADPAGAAAHRPGLLDDPTILVIGVVLTLPLAVAIALWSTPFGGDDWNRSVIVAPFDLALAVVAIASIRMTDAWRALFADRLVRVGAGAFVAAYLIAFAAHPTWLGVNLGLRFGAGLALIVVATQVLSSDRGRVGVLPTMAAVGALQAAVAMAQSARGDSFGISPLDFDGPLYPFGSSYAGRGGLTHPYHLAVFLVVCQGAALLGLSRSAVRWPWLIGLAAMTAGLGVTYSRAAVLGEVAVVLIALASRSLGPVRLAAVAAIVGGLIVGGASFGDGWVARAETSTAVGENPTSSRSERLREAGTLIADQPIVGVGPGNYVSALAGTGETELLPAHNLLAHETAELGPIGLVGTLLLGLALARRALRNGPWALMIAVPIVPFLVLDAYPYIFPAGLAMSALWVALIRVAGAAPAADRRHG